MSPPGIEPGLPQPQCGIIATIIRFSHSRAPRSPTQATLPFATTSVLVAVTLVARHLALHARVPPLGQIHQATPAAFVALSLTLLLLSTPTGVTKASAHQYHTFAAILPDIDCFSHPDAGPALMHAAVKYPECPPEEPPSDDDSA
jgi:hypothetical protein